MSKIVAILSVTLDGVMQSPGRPDEDRRNGFDLGGWAAPYFDPVMAQKAAEGMAETRALLFGRRTYEDFYQVWPNQTGNPFTEPLNNTLKYVASRTLSEPLPWMNSTLLGGEAAGHAARLRAEPGGDIVILGSGELVRSLLPHGLIDEFILQIHPLVLGKGQRLFPASGLPFKLELVESRTTGTGVVIGTYRTAGNPGGAGATRS